MQTSPPAWNAWTCGWTVCLDCVPGLCGCSATHHGVLQEDTRLLCSGVHGGGVGSILRNRFLTEDVLASRLWI
jgi:hypothetical protein